MGGTSGFAGAPQGFAGTSPGFAGGPPKGGAAPFGPGPTAGAAATGPVFPDCLAFPWDPGCVTPLLDCSQIPEVVSTCAVASGGAPPDAGGAPPDAGGAPPDAGAAGTASTPKPLVPWCGRSASPGAAGPYADGVLVDDLDDGDDLSQPFFNGRGAWFVVNDGMGQQFPSSCTPPLPLPAPLPDASGNFAMHTYGKGFVPALGGYSLLGISVKAGSDCSQPVDASSSSGVLFRARGRGLLRFFIGTVETNPPADFGICTGFCYDAFGAYRQLTEEWQTFRVPFSELTQEGWGTPTYFDAAHLLTLQWSGKLAPGNATPASCFDFWIDDVAFYR